MSIQCVLFDLDGTLLDTSYDFTYALNRVCDEYHQPRQTYQDIRKVVSQGGLAMTKLAFPELEGDALETRRQRFLEIYFENIHLHTQLFPGLLAGMQALAEQQIPWGIVTNKPTWLTEKLLASFAFPSPPLTLICGDTLEVRKPDPEPMWLAAKECGIEPENCLYIGDHPRDIEAGIKANMKTAAALFGYLPENAGDNDWPADYHFATPYEISTFIQQLGANA